MRPIRYTRRQQEVLSFIRDFRHRHLRGPTLREIAQPFGVDHTSVRDVLNLLMERGRLRRDERGDLEVTDAELLRSAPAGRIPFFGKVPASLPAEVFPPDPESGEWLEIPPRLLGKGSFYAVEAWGSSMTEAGIADGDIVIVRIQNTAEDGQFVVASLNGAATLKELRRTAQGVMLIPRGPGLDPILVHEGDGLEIQGVVWAWLRRPPGSRG